MGKTVCGCGLLLESPPHNRVEGLLGRVLIFSVSTDELWATQAPGHVAGAVSRTGLQALSERRA